MCGIAGILDLNSGPVDRETLMRMTRILHHRGPDGEGFYVGDGVGLGHQRLAIIDLSSEGNQPLCNEDGSLWVALNGEIYNYRELRSELEPRGHRFKSRTDTEVIIHLYEDEGISCVKRLRGMFALALWDERRHRLVLARDRVGQKPLVYTMRGSKLFFASEVKALLQAEEVEGTLDPESVDLFFAYGFAPWPRTMFKNIWKLPPATLLIVEDGRIRQERYWQVNLESKIDCSEEECCQELLTRLRETMRIQMVSDVPVGLLLSGGLDSSTVAALMVEAVPGPVNSFSVGFCDSQHSDSDLAHARSVASVLKTRHQEVIVDSRLIDSLPALMWHFDEPYVNPVALAHFHLCAVMKRSVTVVHGGDGADELFGGYPGYRNWKFVERFSRLLASHPWACRAIARLGGHRSNGAWRGNAVQQFCYLATMPPEVRRGAKKEFEVATARNLYTVDFRVSLQEGHVGSLLNDFYRELGPGEFLEKQLLTDLLLHNSHGVTMFSDISGMAQGLEIRSIFLDHTVVEFVASLPIELKVKGLDQRKYILRRAVANLIPTSVLRRAKMGYGDRIPFLALFNRDWKDFVSDILFGGTLEKSGFFHQESVERLWVEHQTGRRNNFELLWALTCFGVWYDMCVRKPLS